MFGNVWRWVAVFVRVLHSNNFTGRALLCKMIFINGFMQKHRGQMDGNGNGVKPFFPVTFNPASAGFLCSSEHGKLCFEALETGFVPQNNLPCWELKNTFRSQVFCVD